MQEEKKQQLYEIRCKMIQKEWKRTRIEGRS